MDNLVKMPLEEIDEKDLRSAMDHLFPGHYGDINVFRYVLPHCLEIMLDKYQRYFLDEEDFCDSSLYYEYINNYSNLENEVEGEPKNYSGLRYPTSCRCLEWQPNLENNEIEFISEYYRELFKRFYEFAKTIYPFYFNFLLLWDKNIPELKRLGDDVEQPVKHFKQLGREIIRDAQKYKMSSLEAILENHVLYEDIPDNLLYWRTGIDCAAVYPGLLSEILSPEEIEDLEGQVRKFFLEE